MKLLALCGSLRRVSRCRALLEAAQQLAIPPVSVTVFPDLGALPLFNPDIEANAPDAVRALWQAVDEAEGLIVASPEYAHGVTGTIKNALDWLVGHEPFVHKPVAVLNPSHRAEHADEALKETLRTMAARLIPDACVRIPVTACTLDAAALAADPVYAPMIMAALQAIEHCGVADRD